MRPPRLLLAALIGLHLAQPLRADEDDHEHARAALAAGQILPLSEILAIVGRAVPGHVIDIDFEAEGRGRFRYEFEILAETGAIMDVTVDAATGEILEVEEDD